MKIQHSLLLIIIGCFACSVEEIKDGPGPQESFFYASLDGPSWSGEFSIEGDSMGISSQGTIIPSGDPDIPSVLLLTYNDPSRNIGVTIRVPAQERTTELTDDSNIFGLGVTNTSNPDQEIILSSKSVSLDITELETSSDGVGGFNIPEIVVGNFTGVMIREVIMDGQPIEEAHTIMGDFQYTFY